MLEYLIKFVVNNTFTFVFLSYASYRIALFAYRRDLKYMSFVAVGSLAAISETLTPAFKGKAYLILYYPYLLFAVAAIINYKHIRNMLNNGIKGKLLIEVKQVAIEIIFTLPIFILPWVLLNGRLL